MTDRLHLFYYEASPLLYGHIQLVRSQSPPRQSAPFIISKRVDDNTIVVFGSVYNLLTKIYGSIDDIKKTGPAMEGALRRKGITPERFVDDAGPQVVTVPDDAESHRVFHEYTAVLEKHLLLLSLYSRILFEIVPKLGERTIRVYDYERTPTGDVRLRDVSNLFLHHRYFYVDGEFIKDISSDRRSVSSHFMGGQLKWREYVAAVKDSASDVQVGDITKRMAAIMAKLSVTTSQEAIVFLVQNMEWFNNVMSGKVTDPRYRRVLSHCFDAIVDAGRLADPDIMTKINAGGEVTISEEIHFTAPRFRIHEVLGRRSIDVVMQGRVMIDGRPVSGPKLAEHAVTIGYKEFFGQMERAFGRERMVEWAV